MAKIVEGRLLRSGVAGAGGLGGSEMRICIIGLVRRRSSGGERRIISERGPYLW